MQIVDLGTMTYRDAWARQEQAHAAVIAGGDETVFLVEHPPVITLGRRPDVVRHLIASEDQLVSMGVDVVQSDRGGDITFHGPGQLVCYPVIRLADHNLGVGSYVHRLEQVIVDVLADYGIAACADPAAVGVWAGSAKVCAIGVRVRRGVTMHGLALNVSTDLRYFDLIVPCGLAGRPVTSLEKHLGVAPPMTEVKRRLISRLFERLEIKHD